MRSRAFRLLVYAVFAFLAAPIVIVVVSSFNKGGIITFPPDGWSVRWYRHLGDDPGWWRSVRTSVSLAWWSTLSSLGLGGAAAFAVARRRPWRGRGLYSGVLVLPLVFPFTATGVAIVGTLRTWKLVGEFKGLWLAHVLITLPYCFRAVLLSIRGLRPTYREAALMLGASEWKAFRKVVLPLLRPGIAAGFVFSFLLSFDETTISMLLAGPFLTTFPVKLYTQVTQSADPTIAVLATLQIAAVAVTLLVTERVFGFEVFTAAGDPAREPKGRRARRD